MLVRADVELLSQIVADILRFKARGYHARAQYFDNGRVFRVQKRHACGNGGVEMRMPCLVQEIADVHGYIAKINVYRARLHAAMAHGAVVADVAQLVKMFQRHAAPRLLFV